MILKQCKCGSTEFYNEDDTWRCDVCGRLAQFTSNEEKPKDIKESLGEKNA